MIFNLLIEHLTEHIRANAQISGVPINTHDHKISLFADNVILMITNPTTSLPAVQMTLSWFSEVSYYKVNYTKSSILNLDATSSNLFQNLHPYVWADNNISYLGIHLTKSTKSLFQTNYIPYRTKLQDLNNLARFEFSWIGRLAAFKMLHLPQLLYLFRTLLIPIPPTYFK